MLDFIFTYNNNLYFTENSPRVLIFGDLTENFLTELGMTSSDFDYDYENIFDKKNNGSLFSRILNQILMIFNRLGSDGGLFVVIGKKKQPWYKLKDRY